MNTPTHDSRSTGLASRVREDISLLRQDIGHLVRHTACQSLPDGARNLAQQARQGIVSSSNLALSRLRSLRKNPPRQSLRIGGGALLVGLLAAGTYLICRSNCKNGDPGE